MAASTSERQNRDQSRPWFGMLFVWFFFNVGFVHLFLGLFAWLGQAQVRFDVGQSGISGYVWLIIGCLALAMFFAAPRRSA